MFKFRAISGHFQARNVFQGKISYSNSITHILIKLAKRSEAKSVIAYNLFYLPTRKVLTGKILCVGITNN